jgi:superfamily II DNA/RNA helicase
MKLCESPYPAENNEKYAEHFSLFPYDLSDFQKYAIEAIVEGRHILTTAHTGSGKTLSAEFAIQFFVAQGKKVIYTSPIKALSNQKYYEFTRKYPHITFGLLTGDIKANPDAQVLIMTTEILMNRLFTTADASAGALDFSMDLNTELACVVFDEVHYINDQHRGHVWEQTIITLPKHVQMVMLSATIDAPERFAGWIESVSDRTVYLASTTVRVVPLTHYAFVASTEALYKTTKDKTEQALLRGRTNKLIKLKGSDEKVLLSGLKEVGEITSLMRDRDIKINRKFVLNGLAKYLKDNEMLPAIGFLFSRKQVEQCARELTHEVLEDDSKVAYTVRYECEQIVRKLPNFREYLELPEYNELVKFLEKGVAIHHSGMIPVLREIVELMISKKYVKFLFATESFAIGLDCPIKSAVFLSLTKFDGTISRYLQPHEYTQMAGRAGRRGIDTVGHVIHCNNLFDTPSTTVYTQIMSGNPQTLVSKFKVSYDMVFNVLSSEGAADIATISKFADQSMLRGEMISQCSAQSDTVVAANDSVISKELYVTTLRTPPEIVAKYIDSETMMAFGVPSKKRKELDGVLRKLRDEWKYIAEDVAFMRDLAKLRRQANDEEIRWTQMTSYIHDQVRHVCRILVEKGAVTIDSTGLYALTDIGKSAAKIAEMPALVGALQLEFIRKLTADQMAGVFSCFTGVRIPSKFQVWSDFVGSLSDITDKRVELCISDMVDELRDIDRIETQVGAGMNIESDVFIYDLVDAMMEWCALDTEESCKRFLQEKIQGISVGDFTKACIKVAAVARELEPVAEERGWLDMKSELVKIGGKVLKYIATTQSIYL